MKKSELKKILISIMWLVELSLVIQNQNEAYLVKVLEEIKKVNKQIESL